MKDEIFGLSRLVRLDVKWARRHTGQMNRQEHDHYNPFFELIVVYEGPIYLQVEEQQLVLQSGEVFLLRPWETHRKWKAITDAAGFFWVQFAADPEPAPLEHGRILVDELKKKQLQQQDLRTAQTFDQELLWIPRRFQLTRRFELLHLMERLLDTQNQPIGYFRYASTTLLSQILGQLAEAYLAQSGLDKKIPESYVTYRKVVTHLDEFFRFPLNRELLEDRFNLKYEYLCQLFKKYAHAPMVSYVNELRVQRAKHLLSSTAQPIQDIAGQVGFADAYYFSKVFKKVAGISPGQYRSSQGSGKR